MKKIRFALGLFLFALSSILLSGCATLTYSGEDFDSNNLQTVRTQEEFVFQTYTKSTDNIRFKTGITKTPVPEVLALYVQIDNLSYETPYTFKVEDLSVSNPRSTMQFITTNNYLSIWQNQEAASISAMSAMGSNLANMTNMSANFNEYNQTMLQNQSQETNKSAFSHLERIGNELSKHSIKVSSTISPRKSQYFYFFFEDLDEYPIYIEYKNLNYEFKL